MAKKKEDTPTVPEAFQRAESVPIVDLKTGEVTGEVSTEPPDLKEYRGHYKLTHSAIMPGLYADEDFGLKVFKDDPFGRTHHLKSVNNYWEGTAEEFKQYFEKQ